MCKVDRICRWHKCRAPFLITDARYRGKLYCSPACKQAMKQWKIARGTALVEIMMAWHETRHTGKMADPVTGEKLTAQQWESRFGANHPALLDGKFPDLSDVTRYMADIRAERDAT